MASKGGIVDHEGMLPIPESVDVAGRSDVNQLRPGAVGLTGVLFLTVTGSAPISAMLFNTPIAVGFGNGIGAPAAFLFATLVLVVFSVGYVAMSRKITTAGGFYASSATGSDASWGWRRASRWSPPTACSRSRSSAASPISRRSRPSATGSTSAGTGGASG